MNAHQERFNFSPIRVQYILSTDNPQSVDHPQSLTREGIPYRSHRPINSKSKTGDTTPHTQHMYASGLKIGKEEHAGK